jgi:glycosyltransferase involved in cell wall biosynthesis
MFLTHYFPPEVNAPASRTFEHCRVWVKAGHEVTVVTCAPNHPMGRLYPGYRNRLWQEETLDGIRVIRLWVYIAANEGFVPRILNYLSYLLAVTVAVPRLPAADVVVSTSPQFFCGLAGYLVSRAKRAPWVLEIRDLWPESIVAVGALQSPFVLRMLERIEAFAYARATRIVSVTRSFCTHIEAQGAAPEKIRVITNGVNLEVYQNPRRDPGLARQLGLEGRFVAAYFGTIGLAHHLETALEAAALLEDEPEIALLIVGDGAERARLQALARERRLTNLSILDQQPKERMPTLWGLADVSLVLLKDSPLFRTVIPSKIFEAMAMERPIVLGVDGESREIVEAAACGIPIPPEDPVALAQAIRRLASDPALTRRLGANGRRAVAAEYDRTELARRFADLLEDVARPAP